MRGSVVRCLSADGDDLCPLRKPAQRVLEYWRSGFLPAELRDCANCGIVPTNSISPVRPSSSRRHVTYPATCPRNSPISTMSARPRWLVAGPQPTGSKLLGLFLRVARITLVATTPWLFDHRCYDGLHVVVSCLSHDEIREVGDSSRLVQAACKSHSEIDWYESSAAQSPDFFVRFRWDVANHLFNL